MEENMLLKRLVLILAMAGLLASPAYGKDLWDPPWDTSLDNQTYQAWEFSDLTSTANPWYPTDVDNPYYPPPSIETQTITWPDYVEGPDGGEIPTLHIDEPGGLTIWVPNNPNPDDIKLIFWQITSDKSVTPTGSGPTTTTPGGTAGTNLPSPYPQIQHGGSWYTYNGLIAIQPNPEGEWITWDLLPSTNIEEIVIKTICKPIPEPTTICLFGFGALAFLLKRRFA